jgi:hypothetical protein
MKRTVAGKHLVLSVAILVLALAGRASAGEASTIIDKAIKAAGGEAKLASLKAVTLRTKARFQHGDMEISLSGDASLAELDKLRFEADLLGTVMCGVLSPQGCWRKLGEQVEDARPEALPSLRKLLYAMRAAQMLLPLRDKAVTLAHGGEGKVGDRAAVIVKATHKDHGEVDFYFDKETGLLAKFETRTVLSPTNQECPFECIFSDYKEVEGMKHFTKITFTAELDPNLKLSCEITFSEIKPVPKLEDDLFARP